MPDHTGSALVVEDEPIIRELVAEVLADEGYAVRQAGDGAEALAAAERDRPDLVVSGVRMPRLDGLRLAERLGELRIPVVLVSATLERAPGPGVGFVAKPFALETLLVAVAQAMGGRRGGRRGGRAQAPGPRAPGDRGVVLGCPPPVA